jgi:hypothetical protein
LPRATEEKYRMSQLVFLVYGPRLEPRRFKMCSCNDKHSVKVFCFECGEKSFESS